MCEQGETETPRGGDPHRAEEPLPRSQQGVRVPQTGSASSAAARALLAVNLMGLGVLWALVFRLRPLLPDRIPLHFGRNGLPDRWGEPAASSWLVLPLAATIMTGLMTALAMSVGALARRWPGMLNVPRKKEFVELPPGARERALRPLGLLLLTFPLPFDWLAGWIARCTYEVAIGSRHVLAVWPVFAIVGVELALTVAALLALRRSIIRETTRAAPSAPQG